MECPVCLDPYDLVGHRPKVLVPCGHSVCLQCLQDPAFGERCPQDREPIQGELPLPDNMLAINIITQGGTRPRPAPWCRDCSGDFLDRCAVEGHSMCSRKAMRSEHIEALAASAGQEQHLAACLQGVTEVIQSYTGDLLQLLASVNQLTHLKQLHDQQAVEECKAGLRGGMEAVKRLQPYTERLLETAEVAGLRGRCSVVVQAEGGAEWRGSVALEGEQRKALRHVLLELHGDGELVKVDEAPATPEAAAVMEGPVLDLANSHLSAMSANQVVKFLQENSLNQVRSLSSVDCSPRPPQVCELVLHAVAPHLEDLELVEPQLQHMEALVGMPLLRKLSLIRVDRDVAERFKLPMHLEELRIVNANYALMRQVRNLTALRKLDVVSDGLFGDAPELPLQLEELALDSCSQQQALSIQRMPRLHRLSMSNLDFISDVTFPARSPGFCGLSWLKMTCEEEAPVLSLLRAHADTLQEIRLVHSSTDDGEIQFLPRLYCIGLPDCLRETPFPNLQRLVLLRNPNGCWIAPVHTVESCRLQVREVEDALRPRNSAVIVQCDVCDEGVQLRAEP